MADAKYFVVYSLDRGGAAALRVDVRPKHLEFMKGLGASAKLGGPLMSEDGEQRIGGMYVLEADSLETARRIAASDPFVMAGLFEISNVHEWRWQTRNL